MKDENFKKEINVSNGKIIYKKTDGYSILHSIQYGVIDENKKLEKILRFNMWDDFSFSAYLFEGEEERVIEFEIDKQNPLYTPIINFLGKETQFLLEDDESRNK